MRRLYPGCPILLVELRSEGGWHPVRHYEAWRCGLRLGQTRRCWAGALLCK